MILVPGKFVYLAAPRTGSRTTCDALEQYCGGVRAGEKHHSSRAELAALDAGLPVYSMTRDPRDFVIAAWHRTAFERLADFLGQWKADALGEWSGRLIPYYGFVDHYFLYENGLEDFFRRVGFPGVPLGNRGRYETTTMRRPMSGGDEMLIRERFAEDFARYEWWRQANLSAII